MPKLVLMRAGLGLLAGIACLATAAMAQDQGGAGDGSDSDATTSTVSKPVEPPPEGSGGKKILTEKEKRAAWCKTEAAKDDPACNS